MSTNENEFLTRDKLNIFGKLDYSDVINDNQRSTNHADAWGEFGENVQTDEKAVKGTYKNSFKEHMKITDTFMRDKFDGGDSTLMAQVKIALNDVNRKLCEPVDAGNRETLTLAMQELAQEYDTLIAACQAYIDEKDRFYRRERGRQRIKLVRGILGVAQKERGEFTDVTVINYFKDHAAQGFVLGNLIGYRTTIEGTKTKEEVVAENTKNEKLDHIYSIEDKPGVIDERSKKRAAACRLFSMLSCGDLCTNSRIAGVKDKKGDFYFGTRSEQFKCGSFENGLEVKPYSKIKEEIKNKPNVTVQFSAQAVTDLSVIRLMDFMMGGLKLDYKNDVVLRYQTVNLDGRSNYVVTGAYLLNTLQLFDSQAYTDNMNSLMRNNAQFKQKMIHSIPAGLRQSIKELADVAANDAAGRYFKFAFADVLGAESISKLKDIISQVGQSIKEYDESKGINTEPEKYRELATKEMFQSADQKTFISELFDDVNCKAEWDIDLNGDNIPEEKKKYLTTYNALNKNLHKVDKEHSDDFVKYLAGMTFIYDRAKPKPDILNEKPKDGAQMQAVKRLTAENLDRETLKSAFRLYADAAAEFTEAYEKKLVEINKNGVNKQFIDAMEKIGVVERDEVNKRLAQCLAMKEMPDKYNNAKALKSLIDFAKNQRSQRYSSISDEYFKSETRDKNRIAEFDKLERRLESLRRDPDVDKLLKTVDNKGSKSIINRLADKEQNDLFIDIQDELDQKESFLKVNDEFFKIGEEKVIILEDELNKNSATAEANVDKHMEEFEQSFKAQKNERLDAEEPDYVIVANDLCYYKRMGQPVDKPLFGEDGKIDLKGVKERAAGTNCYLIAVLQALARFNPDYITKHLIKDDPDDPKWVIVTLFDEAGRKQKIRVQKSPLTIAGLEDEDRPLWIQCVEKAALVLIGKKRDDYCPKYRFLDEKEKGGHDYKNHQISGQSLNMIEMDWGSEELASELIFGKRRLAMLRTRSNDAKDYEARKRVINGVEINGFYSKNLIDPLGDEALAKALVYFKKGYIVTCNTAESGSGADYYDKNKDSVRFPIFLTKRHEYVFCGEGEPKEQGGVKQRTVRIQSSYHDETMDITFGEFKHCFTDIHIMPSL